MRDFIALHFLSGPFIIRHACIVWQGTPGGVVTCTYMYEMDIIWMKYGLSNMLILVILKPWKLDFANNRIINSTKEIWLNIWISLFLDLFDFEENILF